MPVCFKWFFQCKQDHVLKRTAINRAFLSNRVVYLKNKRLVKQPYAVHTESVKGNMKHKIFLDTCSLGLWWQVAAIAFPCRNISTGNSVACFNVDFGVSSISEGRQLCQTVQWKRLGVIPFHSRACSGGYWERMPDLSIGAFISIIQNNKVVTSSWSGPRQTPFCQQLGRFTHNHDNISYLYGFTFVSEADSKHCFIST